MSEPTSRLTFADLVQRVARKAGIAYYGSTGSEKAMVPIDTYNLELCKDIINDAVRMFISDAPVRGWRWQRRIMSVTLSSVRITGTVDSGSSVTLYDATLFETYTTDNGALVDMYIYVLTGTGKGSRAKILNYDATSVPGTVGVTAWLDQYGNSGGIAPVVGDTYAITSVETIGGDIARYPLAEDFSGEYSGKIDYAAGTAHGTFIEWCDESLIRAKRSVNVISGYPRRAAIRPLEPAISDLEDGSAKRRFELFLDPEPSAGNTLQFPYNLTFDKLDLETGKATGGSDTTLADTVRTEADDYFNGWKIEVISATGKGSYAIVTDFANSGGVFTVADWLKPDGSAGGTNPAADSIYVVAPVNNVHPAGLRFDESILAACMARLEMDSDELQEGSEQRYMQKAIPLAHRIDARSAPRTLGSMNVGDDYGRGRYERPWPRPVTTEHDV